MSLFTDPAVHEVATENLMRAGQASALTRNADGTLTERTVELLLPEERQMVFEIVEAGFRNIGVELRRQAPGMAGELDRIGLEVRDQDALLSMMLLMSDTRVQRLGLAVARVIRANPEDDRELLVGELLKEMRPRLPEIRRLQRDLVPETLHSLWGTGHNWEMTLEDRNLREMQEYSRTFDDSIESVPQEAKHAAVFGGVLEQGKVLVYMFRNCIRTLMPTWTTQVNGTIGEITKFVATESNHSDFMAALLWPLKFGAQGIDALRATSGLEGPDRAPELTSAADQDQVGGAIEG